MARAVVIAGIIGLAAIGAYSFRDQLGAMMGSPAAEAVKAGGGSLGGSDDTRSDAPKADDNRPAASAKKDAGRSRGQGVAPVTAAIAQSSDMPVVLSAPGTVEALATVAIKPRVDGQIVEVGFREGDLVKEGQILFQLDDRLIKAQIRQAEANIDKDRASLKDAVTILERKQTLLQKQYTSEAVTETQKAQVEGLRASIAAGEALLEAQKTQLDYLTIRAPITGRTGSLAAKVGAFIRSADATPVVTINQTSPIAVTFALPQTELAAVKRALSEKAQATISVQGAVPIRATGTLAFVDNQVDKTTGTVTAKVEVANADEALWPGLSVSVDLVVDIKKNMVSVPAPAVLPAQQGMIAWVIDSDNKVAVRVVKLDRIVGQTAFVSEGLRAGERVVTDGQIRLAPGAGVSVHDPNPGSKGSAGDNDGHTHGKTGTAPG